MPIHFDEAQKLFVISTENSSYAMTIESNGVLMHNYWGERLDRNEDFALCELELYIAGGSNDWASVWQEYSPWGGRVYTQPAIKATFPGGVRDCWLKYKSHKIFNNDHTLAISLNDANFPLEVTLNYTIYDGLDIIDRNSVITNHGDEPIVLEAALSSSIYPPYADKYYMTYFDSGWGSEYRRQRTEITQAKLTIGSCTGLSNTHQLPYFALDTGDTTEDSGRLWFGTLQWSGAWKMVCERDLYYHTCLSGGLNDHDFAYSLSGGESFETPVFTVGYTANGFGGAARMMHSYQREYILPKQFVEKPSPVMYSAWDAFYFDVSEENMKELANMVAPLGVELFCMDDGWFGDRDHDRAGLGDWTPSKRKFPNGLRPLIEHVNSLGMDFGIWVEPEMVNPDSDLYRAHPDWVIHFPGRERDLQRTQLLLNVAREDVKQFILDFMNDLLSNNNIKYIKWDMNRWFAQAGWPDAAPEKQRSIWVEYYRNLYDIFDQLTKSYPDVIFENCASGGMRADLSLMRYCTLINRSDNQDPLDSLYLHEGFTQLHIPKSAGGTGHIQMCKSGVNGRDTSMRFKAHVGLLGTMSISADLRECTPEQLEEMKSYIELYKEVRDTVHLGDFYKLRSVYDDEVGAYQYTSKDKSQIVVFLFGLSMQFGYVSPRIKLKHLEADAVYDIENYKQMSGKGLMEVGLGELAFGILNKKGNRSRLKGDFASYVIVLNRKEQEA